MRRFLTLAVVALLAGCGPGGEQTPLRFDLVVAAGLMNTISSFQVALITRATALVDCTVVQQRCLVDQVASDRYVSLTDDKGVVHKAVVFPLDLKAGTPSTQDVKLTGIVPGKDYALVIEALSKADPPTLAGSSCTFVKEVLNGPNASVLTEPIIPPAVPIACDPRIEK